MNDYARAYAGSQSYSYNIAVTTGFAEILFSECKAIRIVVDIDRAVKVRFKAVF
ncbi:hypothetical protein ES703_14836 [subsurface metagenome]